MAIHGAEVLVNLLVNLLANLAAKLPAVALHIPAVVMAASVGIKLQPILVSLSPDSTGRAVYLILPSHRCSIVP